MFSEKDLEQINKKGLTQTDVESQIERFKTGFPSLFQCHLYRRT